MCLHVHMGWKNSKFQQQEVLESKLLITPPQLLSQARSIIYYIHTINGCVCLIVCITLIMSIFVSKLPCQNLFACLRSPFIEISLLYKDREQLIKIHPHTIICKLYFVQSCKVSYERNVTVVLLSLYLNIVAVRAQFLLN